jgi:hypothetical protein
MSTPFRDPFDGQLVREPSVALPDTVPVPIERDGPRTRIEAVIEFVGPRSIPAHAAARLLDPDWFAALGQPAAWAKRPADTQWQRLTGDRNGSYDSLALSWPLIRPQGDLTPHAAGRLHQTVQPYAQAIERIAILIPMADDLPGIVSDLRRVVDTLDIGISLLFLPARGTVAERDIWLACAALGLQYSPEGAFDWRVEASPLPLFSVHPAGQYDRFSLAQVQAQVRHEGLSLGFSVPLSPNPTRGMEGMLRAARYFCERLGGRVTDDAERFVDARVADDLLKETAHAETLFRQAKIGPGTIEARRLFDPTV